MSRQKTEARLIVLFILLEGRTGAPESFPFVFLLTGFSRAVPARSHPLPAGTFPPLPAGTFPHPGPAHPGVTTPDSYAAITACVRSRAPVLASTAAT